MAGWPTCWRTRRQVCATPKPWPARAKRYVRISRGTAYPLKSLVVPALLHVARSGVDDQVREAAVADEREHFHVLLDFDRVDRRLTEWAEHHLPEVGLVDERPRFGVVARGAGQVA